MFVLVASARCRYGPVRLFSVLSQAAVTQFRSQGQSCRSLQTKAPDYHDAKIEDIRNVGIIAHVDAVRV